MIDNLGEKDLRGALVSTSWLKAGFTSKSDQIVQGLF